MSRRVFVTRHLPPEDPNRLALEAKDYEVLGWSLLKFEHVDHGPLSPADWYFFYSRRGVAHLPAAEVKFLKSTNAQVGTIGPGTAAALTARGLSVDFIGTSEPKSTAEAFAVQLARKPEVKRPRVVFVQAENSRESVMRLLGDRIQATRHVNYRSAVDPTKTVPDAEVYWLTSPLNAQAALVQHPKLKEAELWSVGPTTARALEQFGCLPPLHTRRLSA